MSSNSNLKRHTHEIGLDRALVPGPNAQLGVGRLGADLEIGVPQCLANGVNADVISGLEEVDVGKVALARRVQLSPLAVGVERQELGRVLDRGLGAGLGVRRHARLNSIDGTEYLILS